MSAKVEMFQGQQLQTTGKAIFFIWSIRVRTRGDEGRPGQLLAAEMRGRRLSGSLKTGDWVEFPAGWRPGDRLKRLRNLMTGQEVRAIELPLPIRSAQVLIPRRAQATPLKPR